MRYRALKRLRRSSTLPSFRVESEFNPDIMPQYFQVSVNILETKKLVWPNCASLNSYVIVVLGKKKHRTSIRKNSKEPYFGEFFLFDMYTSIRDMQRTNVWLAVMETRFCNNPRLLGEASICLGTIWAQPHHQVVHKWAQLSLPKIPGCPEAGTAGFLQVDITIMFQGEVHTVIPPPLTADNIDDNVLLPCGTEQQRANYIVSIYGALNLPYNSCSGRRDKRLGKLPSTFLRLTFCGLTVETAVHHRNINPNYCEQVSIVELFPNVNQQIRLEVCCFDKNFPTVIASADIKLNTISHDGENGFLPTFGPSLLHMYATTCAGLIINTAEDGPYHRGALLVALKTIVPFYQKGVRSISAEPFPPIQLDTLWMHEDFCLYAPILEISMLDPLILKSACGLAITIAEIACDTQSVEDFTVLKNQMHLNMLHYTGLLKVHKKQSSYGCIYFPNTFPILQSAVRLPDFRIRMYRNNMVQGIVTNLENVLLDVERRLKLFKYASPNELIEVLNIAMDDASANIIKFFDIINSSNQSNETLQSNTTELDEKILALQKEEIEKIYKQRSKKSRFSNMTLVSGYARCKGQIDLLGTRKCVKVLLAEAKTLVLDLKNCIFQTSSGWPDIVVWLLNGNGSRVAYTKISPANVIYSIIPEQCGKDCGRLQTIYLKPLKCPKHCSTISSSCQCIAARVEIQIWMGLFRQKCSFDNFVPPGHSVKANKPGEMFLKTTAMLLECRAFIYRAKLICYCENPNDINAFVRINALKSVKDTKVVPRTVSPVWNQVVTIQKLTFMNHDRLNTSPPALLAEVYNKTQSGKLDLVGRATIDPVFDENTDYKFSPKLQWYDIFMGSKRTGQILMSAQLLSPPEKLITASEYEAEEESLADKEEISCCIDDVVVPIPENLIPTSSSYKVDIYWWGLRDVNITRKPCVMLEMDDLNVKSEIIANMKCSSNFSNGRISHTFVSSLNELYSPSMSIRLYDSSTFGRTMYLGTNVIKNPNKYLVKWLPKDDREACLQSASIRSTDFIKVSPTLFIKNDKDAFEDMYNYNSCDSPTSCCEGTIKRSAWKKLLYKNEGTEEECALLPVHTQETYQMNAFGKVHKASDLDDWWTRFYYSQAAISGIQELIPTNVITVYDCELELLPEFSKFKDWCSTLKLYNGEKTGIPEKDDNLHCGCLKAGIAIYQWPPPEKTIAVSCSGVELTKGFFNDHPHNGQTKILVRVYIVKAINLSAKDFTGKSDPYVVVSCGKKHLGDRNTYISSTVDPVFGKMFEFRCTLPEDYLLTVALYDYDALPPDNLIGSTTIDLEDRLYTKHRARVGLASEYMRTGTSRWRDSMKPSAILEEMCLRNHIPLPEFPNHSSVLLNGVVYKDSETRPQDKGYLCHSERKENICLSLLRNWQTLPVCGYHLVPEHVETRVLSNPDKPGSDQGKLQLWVDIFPTDNATYITAPYDITPRKVQKYELRLIIWNARSTCMDNCLTSGKFSKSVDLYVRAWIGCVETAQHTDIHRNSTDGVGKFNWRMIFRFDFQHANKKIVNSETGPFTEHEEYTTPFLVIQLLESNDDELLGSLALDLNCMPCGLQFAKQCTQSAISRCKKINMFKRSSMRAWWLLKMMDSTSNNEIPTGAIDLELTLMPCEEASIVPAGFARNPPCPLPVPSRISVQKNSFMAFKSEKFFIVFLVAVAICVLVYMSIPRYPIILRMLRRSSLPEHSGGFIKV